MAHQTGGKDGDKESNKEDKRENEKDEGGQGKIDEEDGENESGEGSSGGDGGEIILRPLVSGENDSRQMFEQITKEREHYLSWREVGVRNLLQIVPRIMLVCQAHSCPSSLWRGYIMM